jgi:p-aminobenzoyl-glutamate transporter AbgT
MFLGFDETCNHIGNISNSSNIPPIFKLFLLPYIIVIWIISVILSISLWSIGFWRCNKCSKVYSIFSKKKVEYYTNGWEDGGKNYYCKKCIKESH